MKKRFFRLGVCLMILAMLFTNLFLARAEGETEEPASITDARKVAQALEIPYYVCDFKEVFEDASVDVWDSELV